MLRTHRAVRVLTTVLLAAGAVALPAAASHAAAASFNLSVSGNGNALGSTNGTIDANGTTATYTVNVCGQSTYPNTRVTIKAGTATASHYAGSGRCESFTGTLTSTSAISSATVTLAGSTFVGSSHTTYTKDTTVWLATAPTQPPAVETTRQFDVTARGGSNNSLALGNAQGSVTATRGVSTASYSVRLCGQNTYPNAFVQLSAGTAIVTHYVSYQGCQTFTGTLQSGYGISTVTVKVQGGTFYPGNTYQTATKTTTLSF